MKKFFAPVAFLVLLQTAVTAQGIARKVKKKNKITPPGGTVGSTAPVKNIVVKTSGYKKDVRALMEKID